MAQSFGEDAMTRAVLSILAGLVVAFVLVFATDAAFHALTPARAVPAGASDPAAMADYVASLPAWLLAGITLGWGVAACAGAAVATRSGRRGAGPGWAVGLLVLAATALNFAMVTHPAWMMVLASVLIAACTWLGTRLGRGARA